MIYLLIALTSFSQDFFSERDWTASIESSGCYATTEAENQGRRKRYDGQLQVFAETAKKGAGYVEPTVFVTVLAKEGETLPTALTARAHGWGRRSGTSEKMNFPLAMTKGANPESELRFVIPLGERQKLIDILFRKTVLVFTLYNKEEKLSSFHFSLRGSSKTIQRQFDECQLEL